MKHYKNFRPSYHQLKKSSPERMLERVEGAPYFARDRYGNLYTTREFGEWTATDEPQRWRPVDALDMPGYKFQRKAWLKEQRRRKQFPVRPWQENVEVYAAERRAQKALARHGRRQARKRKTAHARTK